MYTVIEVATIFKVTRKTVYNWIDKGEIKAVKVGRGLRISEEEVERLKRGE